MTVSEINNINKLARDAKTNNKSLKELQRINKRQIDMTRKRIQNLNKAGLKTPALSVLRAKLPKLSKSNKLTPSELKEQILVTGKFLDSKTGSVRGYKKYEKEELSRLKERGIILTKEEFRGPWKEFLNSDLFKEYKLFDSERAIEEVEKAIREKINPKKAIEAWKNYETKSWDIMDAWESMFDDI